MKHFLITILLSVLMVQAQTSSSNSDPPMMVIEMKPGDTHVDIEGRGSEEFFGRWLTLDTASISTRFRHYSDRFNAGKRRFWNSHIALNREWSVMALATHALSGSPPTSARTRFDLIVGYNLLRRLQSAGLF